TRNLDASHNSTANAQEGGETFESLAASLAAKERDLVALESRTEALKKQHEADLEALPKEIESLEAVLENRNAEVDALVKRLAAARSEAGSAGATPSAALVHERQLFAEQQSKLEEELRATKARLEIAAQAREVAEDKARDAQEKQREAEA